MSSMVANNSKPADLALRGLLIAAFSFTIWHCARINSAEIYLALADKGLRETTLDAVSQDARRHTSHAEQLNRINPDIYVHQAKLALTNKSLSPEQALMTALAYLRRASVLGPARASIWANIVELKSALNAHDEEWQTALLNAYQLGPWEPDVQNKIINYGSRNWLALTPALRGVVISTAKRALRHSSAWRTDAILKTINDSQLRVFICNEPALSSRHRQLCGTGPD